MGVDLEKLTPGPWSVERRFLNGCEIVPRIHSPKDANRECGWVADLVGAPYLGYESTLVNAEFIALARNAFDVMMRRGWVAHHVPGDRCFLDCEDIGYGGVDPMDWHKGAFAQWLEGRLWPDPFTALVEADKWYKTNVEAKS